MGNGALAIGPKLPRPSSTLPNSPSGVAGSYVREQCYIYRRRADIGLVEDDPKRS